MQQVVRPSLGAGAGTILTRFVATVATAVATAVATGPFCVATVATAK
jgi:predicted anti-sigma-YlaC factor YlaD